jgi:hypothetical protein
MILFLGMKKLLQYLAFSAFFIYCVAYGLQFFLHPAPKAEEPAQNDCSVQNPGADAAKRKFEQLAQTDYEDYLKLKTDAEKYKKADEILGKIMAIFMADLGIHLKEAAAKVSPTPLSGTSPSPSPTAITKSIAQATPAPLFKPFDDKDLRAINSPQAEKAFLKAEQFSDPKFALFNASQVQSLNSTMLQGCFQGNLTYSDGRRVQTIKLWMGKLPESPSYISFKVVYLQNGKLWAKDSGSIQNHFLSENSSDQNNFIFYPFPGFYLQLFYNPGPHKLIGTQYQFQSNSTYIPTGTLSLQRSDDCEWINEYTWVAVGAS